MHVEHSQFMPHFLQVSEHALQTGRLQGPLGCPAFPGHLFSATWGQLGPLFQHSTAIDMRLVADFIRLMDEFRDLWDRLISFDGVRGRKGRVGVVNPGPLESAA